MKRWKVLGLAGVAGVAATGVAVARAERRRRAYEPDDVRARLHERYREALTPEAEPSVPVAVAVAIEERDAATPTRWGRVRAVLGRRRRRR